MWKYAPLFLLPFFVGCQDTAPSTEDETNATRRSAPQRPADNYDDPPAPHRGEVRTTPITLHWNRSPQRSSTRSMLTLTVRSFSEAPQNATVRLHTEGLDARERSMMLQQVSLRPHGSTTLEVDLSQLPLQSTTHSAQLIAIAEVEHEDRLLAVQSEAIAYHFSEGYRSVLVYSLDDMLNTFAGGVIDHERAAQARVRTSGGYVDLPALHESEATSRAQEMRIDIVSARSLRPTPVSQFERQNIPPPAAQPVPEGVLEDLQPSATLYCVLNPSKCCTGPNCVKVCADWKTNYVDASNYEDYAKNQGGFQFVDAAYARFELFEIPTCSGWCPNFSFKVAEGYLGGDGCVKVNLQAGKNHKLSISTEHRRLGQDARVDYYSGNSYSDLVGVIKLSTSFPVYSKTVQSTYSKTLPPHPAANAAAALSRAMVVQLPEAYITVRAGVGCNGGQTQNNIPGTDACAPGTKVNTGPYQNPDGSPGDLRWKFVLAHELGHVYQDAADAQPSAPYCFTQAGYSTNDCENHLADSNAITAPLCRCDHVTGSNKLHCMQSIEVPSAAQSEGFAQFFAARSWNNENGNDCDFNYYKQFNAFLFFGTAIAQPPVHLDCRTKVRWRDTFCFVPNGATEYDWLNFLWNVNTVGANTSSMSDLFQIWRIALQGTSQPSWSNMVAAAQIHYGSNSPKLAKFIADGDKYGVDEDKY